MLVNIFGAKCIGIEAIPVTVEVDITSGVGIYMVGLADAAVKESLLRTVTALQSLGFRIPGKKIIINLAPADMHKKGSGYDLPIAIGIIAASGQRVMPDMGKYVIMGELGLDGAVRPVPGALPIAEMASRTGFSGCVLPEQSARETSDCNITDVFGVRSLMDVIRILEGDCAARNMIVQGGSGAVSVSRHIDDVPDFIDIYGQEGAKRGLEIAAAGGHNVLMIGPPGSGKSTLARAVSGILPPMSLEESLQTSKIYSVSGRAVPGEGLMRVRPFRSPHYSTSTASMIGGGSDSIMPGEISLAHNGILFLDEFCEIPRRVLESLRGPIEDRSVTVSRLRSKVTYPSSFMLVAATNPCPCGYYGDGDKCTCTPSRRLAYISRLSGPLIDRIDVQLWVPPVDSSKLVGCQGSESSAEISERVAEAREIQRRRFSGSGIFTNSEMSGKMTETYCRLSCECRRFIGRTIDSTGLSARAYHRVLKLARTIADLDGGRDISVSNISEAFRYRILDRGGILRRGV